MGAQIVKCNISVSVDGFISGPEHLDAGFDRVQGWVHRLFEWRDRAGAGLEGGMTDADSELFDTLYNDIGAL